MRRLLLAIALAAWGCSEKHREPPPQARTSPVEPGAPLNLGLPDQARVKLDLAAARSAVARQQQTSGNYPPSLSELRLKLNYPDDLNYDSSSGTVTSKTYPNL
jgi:hypothetical protein